MHSVIMSDDAYCYAQANEHSQHLLKSLKSKVSSII